MQLRVKCLFDAKLCFTGHCSGNIRGFEQMQGIPDNIAGDRSHDLRAVDQGKPFLGSQFDGGDAGRLHGIFSAHNASLVFGFPFAKHHENHVSKRSKIAACAKRTLFGDLRMNPGIQHGKQCLQCREADAGVAVRKGIDPQQHGGADNFRGKRIAHGAGVGTDKV